LENPVLVAQHPESLPSLGLGPKLH
jgi:hypothetical protein